MCQRTAEGQPRPGLSPWQSLDSGLMTCPTDSGPPPPSSSANGYDAAATRGNSHHERQRNHGRQISEGGSEAGVTEAGEGQPGGPEEAGGRGGQAAAAGQEEVGGPCRWRG